MNVPVKAHEGIIDYSTRMPCAEDVTTRIVNVYVCKVCGAELRGATTFCTAGCQNDGIHSKGTYRTVVFEQTNRVLRVE